MRKLAWPLAVAAIALLAAQSLYRRKSYPGISPVSSVEKQSLRDALAKTEDTSGDAPADKEWNKQTADVLRQVRDKPSETTPKKDDLKAEPVPVRAELNVLPPGAEPNTELTYSEIRRINIIAGHVPRGKENGEMTAREGLTTKHFFKIFYSAKRPDGSMVVGWIVLGRKALTGDDKDCEIAIAVDGRIQSVKCSVHQAGELGIDATVSLELASDKAQKVIRTELAFWDKYYLVHFASSGRY